MNDNLEAISFHTLKGENFPASYRKIFSCECSGEAIEIEYFPEDKQIQFCMWERGLKHNTTLSFKERLRWIWHIITKGDYWTDCVILSKKTSIALANDIIENTKDWKN